MRTWMMVLSLSTACGGSPFTGADPPLADGAAASRGDTDDGAAADLVTPAEAEPDAASLPDRVGLAEASAGPETGPLPESAPPTPDAGHESGPVPLCCHTSPDAGAGCGFEAIVPPPPNCGWGMAVVGAACDVCKPGIGYCTGIVGPCS